MIGARFIENFIKLLIYHVLKVYGMFQKRSPLVTFERDGTFPFLCKVLRIALTNTLMARFAVIIIFRVKKLRVDGLL